MQVIRGLATIAQIIIHYGSNTVWVRAGSPPDVGGALTWQPWSQLARLDGAQTWDALQTFQGPSAPVMLKYTNNTAAVGPYLDLFRESNAATAGHNLGMVRFRGRDGSGGSVIYGDVLGVIADATAGSVKGKFQMRTAISGTVASRMSVESGVVVGSPPGGDQGAGTINLQHAPYVNGAALASSHLAGFDRGTWVPALSGLSTAGDITHTVQNGVYVTDGQWVKAYFEIEAYKTPLGTSPSGALLLSLPFTAAESGWVSAGVVHEAGNVTVGSNFAGFVLRRQSSVAAKFMVQNSVSGGISNTESSSILSASSGSATRLEGCIEYLR